MSKYQDLLQGGDLRSIGKSNKIIQYVKNQEDFDELFIELTNPDRKVVMRTADAIEKITINHPGYLKKHKNQLLQLLKNARNIELKWHMALLISRVSLTEKELGLVWRTLTSWALNQQESKIVRVNSIQGLYYLLQLQPALKHDFNLTLSNIEKEGIPSITARIKKIRKAFS